jgi:hypothetical protein
MVDLDAIQAVIGLATHIVATEAYGNAYLSLLVTLLD